MLTAKQSIALVFYSLTHHPKEQLYLFFIASLRLCKWQKSNLHLYLRSIENQKLSVCKSFYKILFLKGEILKKVIL